MLKMIFSQSDVLSCFYFPLQIFLLSALAIWRSSSNLKPTLTTESFTRPAVSYCDFRVHSSRAPLTRSGLKNCTWLQMLHTAIMKKLWPY